MPIEKTNPSREEQKRPAIINDLENGWYWIPSHQLHLEGIALRPDVHAFLELKLEGGDNPSMKFGLEDKKGEWTLDLDQHFPLERLPNACIHASMILRAIEKIGDVSDTLLTILAAYSTKVQATKKGSRVTFRLDINGFKTEVVVSADDIQQFIEIL